jgi:hypothetical protein
MKPSKILSHDNTDEIRTEHLRNTSRGFLVESPNIHPIYGCSSSVPLKEEQSMKKVPEEKEVMHMMENTKLPST